MLQFQANSRPPAPADADCREGMEIHWESPRDAMNLA
jgi:hypothetical protein